MRRAVVESHFGAAHALRHEDGPSGPALGALAAAHERLAHHREDCTMTTGLVRDMLVIAAVCRRWRGKMENYMRCERGGVS